MGSIHSTPFWPLVHPRVFTKCVVVVAAYLRCQGVQIYPYLDDWLIKSKSQAQIHCSLDLVIATCQQLGFLINKQKSVLVPV